MERLKVRLKNAELMGKFGRLSPGGKLMFTGTVIEPDISQLTPGDPGWQPGARLRGTSVSSAHWAVLPSEKVLNHPHSFALPRGFAFEI